MRTLRRGTGLVCSVLALWAGVAAAAPEDVAPPPRGAYAKDTTGRIRADTLEQVDRLAQSVDASGAGQLGVLVVPTTEHLPPRQYATRLFNAWGVGHAGADDGILLFVALEDRKAEIILGTGLERSGRVTSGDTDVVMRDQVVANFKAGQPDRALLEGARALARLLQARAPAAAASSSPLASSPDTSATPAPEAPAISAEARARVMALLRGEAPDHSPRSWVLNLADGPPPASELMVLERVGNGAYADGTLSFFFVWYESGHADAPTLCSSARDALARQHQKLVVLCRERWSGSVGAVVDGVDNRSPRFTAVVAKVSAAFDAEDPVRLEAAAQTLVNYGEHGLPFRSAQEVFDDVYRHNAFSFWGSLGSFGLLGVFGLRRWNRLRPRACKRCGRPRQRLGPSAELPYLSQAQKNEQDVGSVDYDVWWCGVCHDVWINDNVAWFSRYSRCPGCSARTRQSSTTTVQQATEWSTGLVEVKEWCANCNYQNVYTRVTAQLSSDDSSGSSSSDSSFGGGSSDGGGSSGSW